MAGSGASGVLLLQADCSLLRSGAAHVRMFALDVEVNVLSEVSFMGCISRPFALKMEVASSVWQTLYHVFLSSSFRQVLINLR